MMKVLLLALVLALVLTDGSALKCYKCLGWKCEVTEQTCDPDKDACVSFTSDTIPFPPLLGCITMSQCENLPWSNPDINGCCTADLCNAPVEPDTKSP
ncbi:phospholipase A2 inhibitor NAI-like [Triplophysa rosa]|uniref:CD59 glycoprotein-like n=1 Tax=Triplophysa rosa TaxID=992332 RepID=A0A9W7WJ57_TRIRA|nr:phospholipase A2 inhibitor NAI-like [Triplophysa rosa]KAI7803792.1 putative CD59 glycoprotein-like [Triplophysa rosa]